MAVVTSMLVRWHGGYTEKSDAGGVSAWGRKEGFLQLGNITAEDEVDRIAAGVFVFESGPRIVTTLGIEPNTDDNTPYVGFAVGDTIVAPDSDGADSSQRVTSITVVEDDNGEVTYANELKNTRLVQEETFNRQLKKLLNGSMLGSTVASAPNFAPVTTKAENGDSVGALRDYTSKQLLRRPTWAVDSNSDGIGGGTFDPFTRQPIDYYGVFTVNSVAGFVALPLPPAAFPTGLLDSFVQLGEPGPGSSAYFVTVINSSSDKTQIGVLVVDAAGSPYPDATDLVLNVHAVGW